MAEELNLSDRSLTKLAELLGRVQGNSASRSSTMGGSGGSGGGDNKGQSAIGLATEALTAKFNPLADATSAVKTAYGNLESVITPGMNTWRDLSKTGANFGNDIVGMTAAASGTRMSLAEFGDVIKSNSGNFNGLGGNAAKGAENFAKLSKDMADSGVTDDLRMLGMTSKDINEVLAIQLAGQQTINMEDGKARAKAIQSATALAFEMDQMSKLTGKSRSEQEEIMKKAQADMQAEAKLRILTMGKSEEEAAAIRDNYYKQQKEAELRGQGQMFKEVFATGTIQSEAAANQVAISGKEAEATMKAARATAAGDAQAASEYQKEARLENSKNMRDVNKLQLAVIGDSTAAGKTQMESMAANNAYYRAEQAVTLELQRKGALDNLTADQKAKLIQEETIKQAQAAQTEKKPGSESTEALVKLGARADDAASAVMNGLVVPMNKDVGPALDKFNKNLLSNQFTDKTGKTNTKVQAAEKELKDGYTMGKEGKTVEGVKTLSDAAQKNQPGSFLENASSGVGQAIGLGMGNVLLPGLDKIADKINGIQPTKRAEGAIINNPELAIIGEAGKEYVVPEDKMQTLMQNVKLDGLQSAAKALGGGDKAAAGDKAGGGINLSSLSKEISTSISSVTGGGSTSTNRVQNEDSKKAQQELVALEAAQVAERKKAVEQLREEGVIKGKFASSNDYKNIPQLAALKEKQAGEKAVLSKRVDAGTSWETVREEAKAETTKIVSEQTSITKDSNSTLADMYKDNSKNKLATAKKESESLDDMYKDDSKVNLELAKQRNEALVKEADLAKGVVGTSVKGMSDSMIESMIPKGTKMEDYYIDMNDKLQSNAVDTVARMEKIAKESANVIITEEKTNVETKVAINKTATSLTKEQLEIRAAAEQQIAELRKNGVDVETAVVKATQIIKSDALNNEIAKMTSAAKVVEEQVTKKAESAVVKPKQNPADMFGDMFSDMMGGKGKELPPFMQKLNAQLKDIKPTEIKKPAENTAGTTAQAVKKEASPGKKINPETGEEYTPVPPAPKKEEKPATVGTVEQVGLKDLHTSLEHLNKSMAQLLSYSQQTASAAQAQVKATKGLSNNKFN